MGLIDTSRFQEQIILHKSKISTKKINMSSQVTSHGESRTRKKLIIFSQMKDKA